VFNSLSTAFGFGFGSTHNEEIPELYALEMLLNQFVTTDVQSIYQKILTDVMERTQGITDQIQPLLWDNCVKSESADGLITMLAKAMSEKKDLFLVYEKPLKLVRKATDIESRQIEADYKKRGESATGIYISFKQYSRTDMIKLYSGFEYCTVASLHKLMNLSKALQYKIGGLRENVGLGDKADVVTQVTKVFESLRQGKEIYLDSKDEIITATPDLTAVKEGIQFLNQKRAFYLGLPEAYINGIQTGGLGTTGENDTKAIDRGLKIYFFSVAKPVLESLFKVSVSFKSQDFRQITQALEAIKTFDLVGDEYLSWECKKVIIEGLLGIDSSDNKVKKPAPEPEIEADPLVDPKVIPAAAPRVMQ
jgi:hypothetical protein